MFHVKCNLKDSKSNKRLNLKKLVSVIGYETREGQRLAEANALTGLLKSISKLTIFFALVGSWDKCPSGAHRLVYVPSEIRYALSAVTPLAVRLIRSPKGTLHNRR